MAPDRCNFYNILILFNNNSSSASPTPFFLCMFSIEIKSFVGMCLAFDSGGLIIGLQACQRISRRPGGLSNDRSGDLR